MWLQASEFKRACIQSVRRKFIAVAGSFVCLYPCLCVCHEQVLRECRLHSNHLSWWSVINSLSGVDDLDTAGKKGCSQIYQVQAHKNHLTTRNNKHLNKQINNQ